MQNWFRHFAEVKIWNKCVAKIKKYIVINARYLTSLVAEGLDLIKLWWKGLNLEYKLREILYGWKNRVFWKRHRWTKCDPQLVGKKRFFKNREKGNLSSKAKKISLRKADVENNINGSCMNCVMWPQFLRLLQTW